MRLIASHRLLCTVGLLLTLIFSEPVFAQTGELITISLENASLQTVFSAIESQTAFRFVYTNEQLKDEKPVTISVNKSGIQPVLKLCFKDQPVYYSMEDHFIIIHKKEKQSPGEPKEVMGTAINEKGEPVMGATVALSGTQKAVATAADGSFTLEAAVGSVLVFSGTNVETEKFVFHGQQPFLVSLKTKISFLDDVQIIAYGTTTRRLATGDIGTVKSETIAEQPVSNVLSALEGRVPGLLITQQSGIPGAAINVQIMGQNSIASGNQPLYIVDGVPFIASIEPQVDQSPINLSPFNNLNPGDIESIDVLKDADATAIYGSRGSNGVILITTKKGKAGKTSVDINVNTGIGEVDRTIKWLNTPQYLEMRNQAFSNDGTTPGPYDFDVNGTWDTTRYTDWQKMLIGGHSNATNAQVSLSGGSMNTQFLISGNYHRETTVFPGTFNDTRAGMHINITHSSADRKFVFGFSGSYSEDVNKLPNADFGSYYYLTLPPDAPPVYDAEGKLNWDNGNWGNPISLTQNQYKTTTDYLLGNVNLSYNLLPGLYIKAGIGYTANWLNNLLAFPSTSSFPGWGIVPHAQFGNSVLNTLNIEPQLNYTKQMGRGKFDVLFGGTIQQSGIDGYAVNATGFTSDQLIESISNASTITPVGNTYTQYKYAAIFGRINYQLLDKYIFNLTARRDGSSRFGPGKQYANFGSVGAAWIFSKENLFLNHFAGLSFGKIRLSYGTTGNDQIGDYQYLSTYSSTYYSLQGNSGLVPTRIANPDYSWEVNRKFEAGLDLGFMNDRIYFDLAYFQNRCSNQLLGLPLPALTGFVSVQANLAAVVRNTGFEIGITTTNIKTKTFTWKTYFNVTIPKNELISYPGLSTSNYQYQFEVGKPLNTYFVYQIAGIDPQSGVYQFRNVTHGGTTLNPAFPDDLVAMPVTQKYYGGLSNEITWKNWQIDLFFQYVNQKGINGLLPGYPLQVPGLMYNQAVTVLSRWQKPGDISSVQKFTAGYTDAYISYANAISNLKIVDASYLRLKNLSVSFSFKPGYRVYLQGQNLFTISHFPGLDPENQSGTPPIRMVTGGFQFTF